NWARLHQPGPHPTVTASHSRPWPGCTQHRGDDDERDRLSTKESRWRLPGLSTSPLNKRRGSYNARCLFSSSVVVTSDSLTTRRSAQKGKTETAGRTLRKRKLADKTCASARILRKHKVGKF